MDQTLAHERHNQDLLNCIPKKSRYLIEIGCSSGALAREFKKNNEFVCDYFGVEIDAANARLAQRYCDQTAVLDIEEADEDFWKEHSHRDCWIFGDTLEHLRDPWRILRNIRAVIPPHGAVVACIPNAQHWSLQVRINTGDLRYGDSGLLDRTHIRFFTLQTILEMFQQTGFQVTAGQPRIFNEPQRDKFLPILAQLAELAGCDSKTAITDCLPLQYVVKAIPQRDQSLYTLRPPLEAHETKESAECVLDDINSPEKKFPFHSESGETPTRAARQQGGGIAAIAMVKNEQDIIEPFVRHNIRFLDHLMILDNGSVDDTKLILKKLAVEFPNLMVVSDDAFGYTQSERMTDLLQQSQTIFPADFVLLLDADEFIHGVDPASFTNVLARVPPGACGKVAWCTFVLTPEIVSSLGQDQNDTLQVMTWRRRVEWQPFYKVIIRLDGAAAAGLVIAQGNHSIRSADGASLAYVALPEIKLCHYPIRSREQLIAKTVVGWMAYLAKDPLIARSNQGSHWRENFERIANGEPLEDSALCQASLLYAQSPRAVNWDEDVVHDPIGLVYERRYSTGQAMDAMQLIARSWQESIAGSAEKNTRKMSISMNTNLQQIDFREKRQKLTNLLFNHYREYANDKLDGLIRDLLAVISDNNSLNILALRAYAALQDNESRRIYACLFLCRYIKVRDGAIFFTEMLLMVLKNRLIEKGKDLTHYDDYDCNFFWDKPYFSLPKKNLAPSTHDDHQIFIDCGAYDGETIKDFVEFSSGKYDKIYSFEPIPSQYENTLRNITNYGIQKVELIQKGVWSHETVFNFIDGEAGSTIHDRGTIPVKVVAIDEVVPNNEKVTFIKMDVEGAEFQAIKGAEKTIRRCKPSLAICIYHKPQDIIDIPMIIISFFPGYKFYIRHHYINQWETVLYALPPTMETGHGSDESSIMMTSAEKVEKIRVDHHFDDTDFSNISEQIQIFAEHLFSSSPQTLKSALEQGVQAFGQDDHKTAMECLSTAITEEPDNPLPLTYLAFIAVHQDAYEDARTLMAKAMALAPERAELPAALGEIFLKCGQATLAEEYLRMALDRQPDLWTAYLALAQALRLLGRGDEALSILVLAAEQPSESQQTMRTMIVEMLAERGDLLRHGQTLRRYAKDHGGGQTASMADLLAAVRDFAHFDETGENVLGILGQVQEMLATAGIAMDGAIAVPKIAPARPVTIAFLCADFAREGQSARLLALLKHLPPEHFRTLLLDADGKASDYLNHCALLADTTLTIATNSDESILTETREIIPDILISLDGYAPASRLALFHRMPSAHKLLWDDMPMPPLAPDCLTLAGEVLAVGDAIPTLSLPGLGECHDLPDITIGDGDASGPRFICLAPASAVAESCWQLFATILQIHPESSLLINLAGLGQEAKGFIGGIFTAAGVESKCLRFAEAQTVAEWCALCNEASLGLAPPLGAGGPALTACLWMGRPYIAMASLLPWSRRPAVLLDMFGLGEWVAASPEDYLERARRPAPAADSSLRQKMTEIGLNDSQRFALAFATVMGTLLARSDAGPNSCQQEARP